MGRHILAAFILALAGLVPAGATSYAPVSFGELVARADVIFVGEVVDVRPLPFTTRDGTIIKTRVVFRVSDPIWGTSAALEVFDFFGGEWGGVGMAIAEMPTFAVGDRRVVFARRERSINPIVGFRQGLLQVRRDAAGADRVLTLDGRPIDAPESIGAQRAGRTGVPAAPMRLADFRARIGRALAGRRR
ncbi:MAG: hypothetical protein A3F70_05435 [Acidobacteria bacterium RIFCSPLOWO2_12_FULL_67_14]|nr:MAG: hypothetical protein A3H29_07720 [Acidobacteria bacterium RIFCSPLOWO2_02_FULL_67_21]OFW38598.1 MAG: hypothetical protein A3F70_05435 [Acidobacteria bacterium RIFCSPLOWO2_12_FULL_67_14]